MNALIESLNRWGEIAIPLAGQVLWQSSLLIVVLLALDLLLRHRIRAGFRYALWMLLLVKLVLPPSLALPTGAGYWIERPQRTPTVVPLAVSIAPPRYEIDFPAITTEPIDFEPIVAEMPATLAPQASPPPPAPRLTRDGQLVAWWLGGMMFLLAWMLWRWRWVNRLVRQSEKAPARLQALLTNVCRDNVGRAACPTSNVSPAACRQSGKDRHSARSGEVNVGTNAQGTSEALVNAEPPNGALGETRPTIAVRLTDTAMSPAVCGLFRPVILLPRKLVNRLTDEQLRTVLLHELIHLRRRDLWVNCLQTLLQIAAWWHPLLWVANARIRRVREEAVDEAVACALRDDADAYPATLLEVAKLTFTRPLMTLGLVGILESKNALKQRIRRLLELPPLESTRLKWWQWVAVAAVALAVLPMAQGQRRPDEPASRTIDQGTNLSSERSASGAYVLLPHDRAARLIPRPSPDIQSDSFGAWIISSGQLEALKEAVQAEAKPAGDTRFGVQPTVYLPSEVVPLMEGRASLMAVTHRVLSMIAHYPFEENGIRGIAEGESRILGSSAIGDEEQLVSHLRFRMDREVDSLQLKLDGISRTRMEWTGLPSPLPAALRSNLETNFEFTASLAVPLDSTALLIRPSSQSHELAALILVSFGSGDPRVEESRLALSITKEGGLRWNEEPVSVEEIHTRLVKELGRHFWLRVELDALEAPEAVVYEVTRRIGWANAWNVTINPSIWTGSHDSVRLALRSLPPTEVGPRLAELISNELLAVALDGLTPSDRAEFPTTESLRKRLGVRHRQGPYPLEIAVTHSDAGVAGRTAMEIAWAYCKRTRYSEISPGDVRRIDDSPNNPRRVDLRIREIVLDERGRYRVGSLLMSLDEIGAALRSEAAINPRFQLVHIAVRNNVGEVRHPPNPLRQTLITAGIQRIAIPAMTNGQLGKKLHEVETMIRAGKLDEAETLLRAELKGDPTDFLIAPHLRRIEELKGGRTNNDGAAVAPPPNPASGVRLQQELANAQAEVDRAQRELRSKREQLKVDELWLLDDAVLEHPFVKRHVARLGLTPPSEFQAARTNYVDARRRRDVIDLQFAQERINQQLRQDAERDLSPEDRARREAAVNEQVTANSHYVDRLRDDYEAVKERLGRDPLEQPDLKLEKAEFLRLMPVVEAAVRLQQAEERHGQFRKIVEANRTAQAPQTNEPRKLQPSSTGQDREEVRRKVQEAGVLIENGKLDEAETLLREAAKDDPGNSMVSFHLAAIERARREARADRSSTKVAQLEGRPRIMQQLNRITVKELKFEGLALKEVVKHLRDDSVRQDVAREGVAFMIVNAAPASASDEDRSAASEAPLQDIGETVIDINPPLQNLRLIDALNAVVMAADRRIKFTVEEFGVVFTAKPPEKEPLETREFRVNPKTFQQGMQGVALNMLPANVLGNTNPPARPAADQRPPTADAGVRFLTTTNDMSAINAAARAYFEAVGLDLKPPKALFYNDRKGLLLVRATLEDLELVQRAVEILNYEPPQIQLEARAVELSPEEVKAVASSLPPYLFPPVASTDPNAGPASASVSAILTAQQFSNVLSGLRLGMMGTPEATGPMRVTTLSGRHTRFNAAQTFTVCTNMVNTPTGPQYETSDIELGKFWELTPEVGADGYTIHLAAKFDRVEFLGYNDPAAAGKPPGTPLPHFSVRSVSTKVSLWDGQTLVMGGITIDTPKLAKDKVPVLGDIPLVGKMFRYEKRFVETKHVVVFITPTIIDPAGNPVHKSGDLPLADELVPPPPTEP